MWAASRSPGGSVCTFWFCQTCGFGCRVRNRCPYSSCTFCMRGPWRLLLRWLPWDCQLTPASLLLPCFLWGGPWVAAEELGLPLCVCVGDWLIQSSLRSVWGSIEGDSLGMRLDVLLASPSCGRLVVGCLLLRPFPLGGLIAPPSFPWRGAGGRAGGYLPQPQLPPALLFNLRPNRAVGESGKQNVGDQQTSKPATTSSSRPVRRMAT